MSNLLIAAVFGYVLGSFPTAFLLVRWKSKIDIRTAGSGNVGAFNSLVVSGSHVVGISVLLLDLLKGILVVLIASLYASGDFWVTGVAGISAVAGHNFPVWLRFRGGRGLATAAGVFVSIAWVWVVLWLAIWGVAYLGVKEINPANAVASTGLLLALWMTPTTVIALTVGPEVSALSFQVFGSLVILLVLVRHIQPVKEFFDDRRKKRQQQ